jgi:outer membrane lipoprotein LolB
VRRPQLQAREHFDLKGRVAVAAGNEGFNARLLWRQTGTRSNVALDGPLGAGGVQITADGSSLSVVTSRGDHLDNDAARAELATRLGFDPPIGSLRFWVLGVPDPANPATETLDAQQRLASLQQDGWQVDYAAYTSVDGEWLPSRVTLRREGVRVRLIVDGWSS